jgi:hypothetical protein
MPGFTDPFGGGTLQAAQVAYRAVSLTGNVSLVWPPFSTSSTDYIARLMNVTPSGPGFAITLDDATQVSTGQDAFFNNLGASTFTVKDSAGGTICTVAAGQVKYVYLTGNSTAAGTWSVVTLGVGTSSPDAAALAGYGLKAASTTLQFAPVVSTFNANTVLTSTARAGVYVWTGGTGTLTLPALASASSGADWEIEVRNQGTGTLSVLTTGGEQIDGGSSIALNVTESCFVHTGPTAWYTVGRGRNTSFSVTALTKSVTGGTTTLSLTEAGNVIQIYSGALVSNQSIVVPSVVQVYYITNNTTGAFTFTVKTAVGGGLTVAIPQGASAVVYCDGTNIINCSSTAALTSVTIAAGSAASPSLNFSGDLTTGMYQPSAGQLALTIEGTQRLLLTATGLNNTAIGVTTPSTGAFTTLSATGAVNLGSGAVTCGAINGTTVGAGGISGASLIITSNKIFQVGNSINLAGVDSGQYTLPNPPNSPSSACSVGYLGEPQNDKSADYTSVLTDNGLRLNATAGSHTFTIAANASVAYPKGAKIVFTNASGSNWTIAIASDTMHWAAGGGTGSRTLANWGVAIARKVDTAVWIIDGTGLT